MHQGAVISEQGWLLQWAKATKKAAFALDRDDAPSPERNQPATAAHGAGQPRSRA